MDKTNVTIPKDPDLITVDDVLSAMVGLDKDGDPKAVVYIAISEMFDDEDRPPEEIKRLVLHNTHLSDVGFPGNFVMTELEFRLTSNTYMQSFCEMVSEFHHLAEENRQFGFFMQVASLHNDVKFVLSFECPLVCVQGISSFSNAPTKLQVVFPLEGFVIYQANYNLSEIRAEVGREMDEEEELYGKEDVETLEESLTSDIDEQVKEAYGINNGITLTGEKKELKSSIDKHMRITK